MNSTLESPRPTQVATAKSSTKSYTLFVPFVILLVVLIIAAARDTASLHREKETMILENQKTTDLLAQSALQADALRTLKDDLQRLAAADPVAAKINMEYFPPASSPNQNPTGP